MRKLRVGRVIAAASAAALLIGGIFLLTKDSASQKKKERQLEPFVPKPILLRALDSELPQYDYTTEVTEISSFSDEECITQAVPDTLSDDVREELINSVRSLNGAYPNAIAWLYLPDTPISYPIMQSDDNDFYLHHAYDGSGLVAGSIFLDYRCESRFMNNLNILYGHNMKNGSMFAGITRFRDSEYFDTHRYGWLITCDSVNRIDFFSSAVTDWHDEIYDGFRELSERIPHIRKISRIYEDIPIFDNDRLLVLSTCSYEFQNARTLLIGKITEVES